MYKKDPCPLCNQVKLDVEPFLFRCCLQTVDITEKGNERWLNLYKYQVPVMFFNGQFLCKHKLDTQLLERRLKEYEAENPHVTGKFHY